MKNLHLIPTDNASRLYLHSNGELQLRVELSRTDEYLGNNQHIYITSDEEIKEGDWYYLPRTNSFYKCNDDPTELCLERKFGVAKIILTTDQDLIKDGVQDIDDELLEWFVMNPSCESVEVKHFGTCCGNQLIVQCINCKQYNPVYKIIIPKEEPKLINNCSKCGLDLIIREHCTPICTDIDCRGIILSNETLREWASKEEPKQETLEEAAARLYPINNTGSMFMPSRDEVINSYKQEGFIEGAKWQQERMYSEEEVQIILSKLLFDLRHKKIPNSVEWFEQFKKK